MYHHLLVARLKLKLKKNWTGGNSQRQRYNTDTLKDTWKQEEFNVTLQQVPDPRGAARKKSRYSRSGRT
ncbi:hypothetical protein DPMN_022929 [Dreissena polymorpha]|uniref:Uncharacterized protein n=1 Tax=Dreissena polymorpha TaxID=45954 RepID=A0A9D4LNN9_DREPO|nr:hypothetical protein DPMN_022929 [Dreissena polymorpha]